MKTKAVATRLEQEVAEKFEALSAEKHLLPSELARIVLSAWATGEFDLVLKEAVDTASRSAIAKTGGDMWAEKSNKAVAQLKEELILDDSALFGIPGIIYLSRLYTPEF